MNGSKSPAPPVNGAGDADSSNLLPSYNGQRGLELGQHGPQLDLPTQQHKKRLEDVESSVEPADKKSRVLPGALSESKLTSHHDDDDAASEAETLISSPVKKREAERRNSTSNVTSAVKSEPSPPLQQHLLAPRHRIGGLPVPTDMEDEVDSTASPVNSTETDTTRSKPPNTVSSIPSKDENIRNHTNDGHSQEDSDSDSLSSVRSDPPSRASSRSRAASERPDYIHQGIHSPNPRKRKHRASSVNLPNKRSSVEVQKQRRLPGLHSEEFASRSEQSPSPKLRSHRRAVSTQSAFVDGASEHQSRKRRAVGQGSLGRESKSAKSGWEESDASSETTSHGHAEARRPMRGIGRSTSTPGRPPGREHKRYVNKYGFTKLAEACEIGDLDLVKEWREKDPDQIEQAEFAGNKPLQIAALNGNVEVVDYLIDEGCQIDCANVDKDTPLIDAAENGHLDVVISLLKAGVDPLRQNLKGQQALDVVTDEPDDADEIRSVLRIAIDQWNSDGAKQRREEEEEQRHRAGPTKELHFMARTYENLMKLVQINDRTGVREFLDARVPVDNGIITAAARTGDSYLVNMLLAEMTEKKALQKPEKPMLGVLGTSHFDMVESLTQLEYFNPLYRNRQGLSWVEIAEQRNGPNLQQEIKLLQRLHDERIALKQRRSSSPVSKRDNGKRRIAQMEEDDSTDEEAPKRKNGRRLMSKKDMRAANGKTASDSSSEESGSEIATGAEGVEETSMKPPQSPPTKRRSGRPRTNSISAQSSIHSPESRRRSLSLRADQPLAKVEEKVENPELTNEARNRDGEPLVEGQWENDATSKRDQEAEAAMHKAVKEEATRQADATRQREEEEESRAAAARQAELERRADEGRRADEIRRQEEERQAEEARKIEHERKRVEAEMAEARRVHREGILANLPSAFARVLDPQSAFDHNSESAPNYLVYHFTPLQVIRQESHAPHDSSAHLSDSSFWIVNIQAAPLIGQRGMELLIRSDIPGYKGSLLETWETKEVTTDDDLAKAQLVLANLPDVSQLHVPATDEQGIPQRSYEEELQQIEKRVTNFALVKERIRNDDVVLRLVRLDDVLRYMHPVLRSASIEVRFDHLTFAASPVAEGKDRGGFVESLGDILEKRPTPHVYVDGKVVSRTGRVKGSTKVTIVEDK